MNTRVFLIAAVVAVISTFSATANHIPTAPAVVAEFAGRSTLLIDLGRFDPLVEVEGRLEDTNHEFRYRGLTAGTYLRLHKNLKAGAFYRIQQGARQDDDWIEPVADVWEWVDSRSRIEQVLILDVSPRFLFTFSLNYGFYIPLNFGETFLYEHEPYLSVLYHLNRSMKLELTGAYKTVTWSSSEDSLANGDTYAVNYRAFVFGFGLLFPVTF